MEARTIAFIDSQAGDGCGFSAPFRVALTDSDVALVREFLAWVDEKTGLIVPVDFVDVAVPATAKDYTDLDYRRQQIKAFRQHAQLGKKEGGHE